MTTIGIRPRPIGLTNAQLEIVLLGARGINPIRRCRYLGAVADILVAAEITDASVQFAVSAVLQRMAA